MRQQFTLAVKVLQQAVASKLRWTQPSHDVEQSPSPSSNLDSGPGRTSDSSDSLLHAQSLNLLQTGRNMGTSNERSQILAQSRCSRSPAIGTGQAELALTTWRQAADTYAQVGDNAGITVAINLKPGFGGCIVRLRRL